MRVFLFTLNLGKKFKIEKLSNRNKFSKLGDHIMELPGFSRENREQFEIANVFCVSFK